MNKKLIVIAAATLAIGSAQAQTPKLSANSVDEVLKALCEIEYDGPFNLELPRYQNCFTTEDLPLALKLAVQVGRRMMTELGQG